MASRTSTDPIEILLEMGETLIISPKEDYLSALIIDYKLKQRVVMQEVALREEIKKKGKRKPQSKENKDICR